MGSCLYRLTEARSEACPQCTNDCANTRAELVALRWSFFCGVCCSLCFAGDSLPAPFVDYSSHGRPMLQVLEAQCYKIATMKLPAVWYKGLSERICSYSASVHFRCRDGLPTLRLLRACGHSNTRPQQCGVAETPAHAISQVSEHVLLCVMRHQVQTAKLNVKT